jgi:hypothetical protein
MNRSSLSLKNCFRLSKQTRPPLPLPADSTFYIRLATQEMAGQNDIRLLPTEQELICKLTEQGEGYRLITYPLQCTIKAVAEVINEIQRTKPIMVILTIYY